MSFGCFAFAVVFVFADDFFLWGWIVWVWKVWSVSVCFDVLVCGRFGCVLLLFLFWSFCCLSDCWVLGVLPCGLCVCVVLCIMILLCERLLFVCFGFVCGLVCTGCLGLWLLLGCFAFGCGYFVFVFAVCGYLVAGDLCL